MLCIKVIIEDYQQDLYVMILLGQNPLAIVGSKDVVFCGLLKHLNLKVNFLRQKLSKSFWIFFFHFCIGYIKYIFSAFWNTLFSKIIISTKKSVYIQITNDYRTRAIISRGLYTFLPHFQRPFMYCDLWPYVWLVFKSSF